MVNLALLCNLYADGPTTLGRLRELGCETLEAVEQLQRADLEWALQAGSTACDRFRREARLLREREGAARTAATGPTSAANSGTKTAAEGADTSAWRSSGAGPLEDGTGAGFDAAAAAAHESVSAPATSTPARSATRDNSILGVLLQAWRRASGRSNSVAVQDDGGAVDRSRLERNFERRSPAVEQAGGDADRALDDRSAYGRSAAGRQSPDLETIELPPRPRATGPAAPGANAPVVEPNGLLEVGRAGAGAPSIERRAEHGTPLDRIRFQGVEADYAEQIAHLGIRTVEDFLAAQPLDLAGRSTMRYTVLLRMQFLARRELERAAHG